MKTLITGANGFVGAAVARCLIKAEHDLRALVRPGSNRNNLTGLPIEIAEGDLQDKNSLEKAVDGCTSVFHVAADYRLWVPNPEHMYKTNVTGTRDLFLAAAAAGVEKIVYTSSVATLGLNANGTPADEDTPVSLDDMIGPYKRSKYLAEETVKKLIESRNLPVVIVNPSTPLGPRDIKPTPTGRIIIDALTGRMPAYVDTGLNIVHVDDVAQGHLFAWEKGKVGERYILGGENLSLKALLEMICEIGNKKPPSIRLPHNLIMPIAWGLEKWAELSHRKPLVTVDEVRMSKKLMYFSAVKAARALGYQFRPARQAVRDAIDWFGENENYI